MGNSDSKLKSQKPTVQAVPKTAQVKPAQAISTTAQAKEAFELAQSYQSGKEKNKEKAFEAYLQAARLGYHEALFPLARLGEEMAAKKQLELSHLYGAIFHCPEKAEYWRAKANEVIGFKFIV